MVITGMNRFFAKHGKIAFGFIAIVIIFTFAFFMTGMSVFDLFGRKNQPATVSILGRKVTKEQRVQAVDKLLIQQALVYPAISLENVDYSRLDRNGITNLMLTYASQDRGIAIGDKEVKKYLQSVPAFQTKGKFDSKKFNTFVDKKLKPRHFDKEDLDAAVREKLAVEKLTADITDNVIVPSEEIKDAYFNLNEKAKVSTAEFKTEDFTKKIKISDEEAKSYYEANKTKYMTPPAVKIELVRFENDRFKKQAWKSITEKEVKEYYDKNKHLYLKKEVQKKDKKPKKPEYQPLKDVAVKIKQKLSENKAKVLAAKAANKFSEKIYDMTSDIPYDIKNKAKALAKCREEFAQFAKEQKKELFTPDFIYEGQTTVSGIGNEPKLAKAAAARFLDDPISDPVKGKKAAYVFILTAKKAPQPETYAKQKTRILKDMKQEKALNLARETARETAMKISESLDKGKSFSEISKKTKILFKPLPMVLVASRPPFMLPNGQQIHTAAFKTAAEKLAPVQEIENGALLIYVISKQFPTQAEFEKQQAMFTMQYKRMKQQSVWIEYTQTLLAASNTSGEKNKKTE